MLKRATKGTLEVICGSMFSGKSEELIKRLRRAELANLKLCVFKHKLDDRMTIEYIYAHSGEKFKAIALENPYDMYLFISDETQVIALDEVQFFSNDIIAIILDLIDSGKRVIAAGLNLDFRGVPFGCMPTLMALADSVTKLSAVCRECGKDAHYTQRLIDGKAAKFDDPIIMVGAQECYQARCRDCYIIDQKAWVKHEQNQNNL
ncbi:thymidine kinase [Candidatus Dependentiae bacterium]|nr:thymidine kinase [Candidatus Dependentiae bacterium]